MRQKSRRQELGDFANAGQLRNCLDRANPRLSGEAIDLCVDVVLRYCEPRRPSRMERMRRASRATSERSGG